MAKRKDELEVEVLELPVEDRADLARRLIESLEETAVGNFEAEWIEIDSSHGTGCTLSAALAANLALGASLPEAVALAKAFVTRALRKSYAWDHPAGELRAINQLPTAFFTAVEASKELRAAR